MMHKIVSLFLMVALLTATSFTGFNAQQSKSTKLLPEGTRVYVTLQERVSGKRGDAEPGQIVPCVVWRDVIVNGNVLVQAGSPVLVKVDQVKHANIAGVKGKVSLAAFETKAVDGQKVQLTGGYMKEGKGRMGLSITLGVLLLPLIFIMGKAAMLPDGMVFDTFTGPDMQIALPLSGAESPIPIINLAGSVSKISAEVLLDNLQNEKKPEVFNIRVNLAEGKPSDLKIDQVNGKPIEPIPLTIVESVPDGAGTTTFTTVPIKKLAEHFQRGINRFDVSYQENGARVATEVILNVQM